MGLLGMFKNSIMNTAGIKILQQGSDILIIKNTPINTFNVPSPLRDHANSLIKQLFLNGFMEDMTEEEAALLKLSIFYRAAEEAENEDLMDLIGESISKIREIGEGKIRAQVSLQVMGETGN